VIRLVTGAQPIAEGTADQFLIHFAPYFVTALTTVAVAGTGAYTFAAFGLAAASYWIHVQASIRALLRRAGRFVVTPKRGAAQRQPRAVAPTLLAIATLIAVSVYGLGRDRSPATLNNVAFALLHVSVLSSGAWYALRRQGGTREAPRPEREKAERPRAEPELVEEAA
jgi:cellulose synthase (UDP-forming)